MNKKLKTPKPKQLTFNEYDGFWWEAKTNIGTYTVVRNKHNGRFFTTFNGGDLHNNVERYINAVQNCQQHFNELIFSSLDNEYKHDSSKASSTDGWQRIETAPLGVELIAAVPSFGDSAENGFIILSAVCIDGRWYEVGDQSSELYEPTFWMHIPPIPLKTSFNRQT